MTELLYEVRPDGVALIILNRPERLNAFTRKMIDLWVGALEDARGNDAVQVVVVTGAGRAFCSGGDVGGMNERPTDLTGLDHKRWLEVIHRVPLTLETLDKPVIAAMNGVAVGAGLDMALMCDLRYAAAGSRFSEGYVKVGLIPGDGGTYFLPRLVGTARALELLWTGDFISAEDAASIGLVNRVVPADELLPTTLDLAARLASGPTVAIRTIKRAVYQGVRTDLRTHLDLISSHMAIVRQTHDHREGARAFVEKRPPRFVGH
ncbi:MAG TPA: enoyl-CoA hydratase-related protein [Chloroflexota bacterium]|nr:enoyl-CoA hydratase-related protein [Chloroflexota bacterium]